jgi:starch phosphorylase
MSIPTAEIVRAHRQAKRALLVEVEQRTGVQFDLDAFTIGFARRATVYKRPALLFSDLKRLQRIASSVGPLQVIYGGKAHPQDEAAKELIRKIFAAADALQDVIKVVYIEDYDIALARYFCSGVDPYEASGTSGMKASLNGVPSLSVLDGWWLEGHIEGVTGWAVGSDAPVEDNLQDEIDSLYAKLRDAIVPMYYRQPERFAEVMRSTIAFNGSFFTTQRMLVQYLQNVYRL